MDGLEYRIVGNRSTAILSFIARKTRHALPHELTIPLVKVVLSQATGPRRETVPNSARTHNLVNRAVPPFDNPAFNQASYNGGVKDMTIMVNNAYNGWQFADVWLQK